jgi:SAM-dependent methyltransferase
MLQASGYTALGVDPEAPDGEEYRRIEFERLEPVEEVDAVVAVTSLHHVADPGEIVDRIARMLPTGGALVVVEWDWQELDEATARWCFSRLGSAEESRWLYRHHEQWLASAEPWDAYLPGWARAEGLHSVETVLGTLEPKFDRVQLSRGPYLFPNLPKTSEEEELAAIAAGEIRATRVDYVGRRR